MSAVAQRAEAQATAAAADRGRQPARGGADQQQHRARRRLLQHLQQRVGGVAVEVLRAVQHHHAPAALGRRQAQEVGDAADVIDHDLAAQPPALLVPGALDRQQIGVRSGGDAAEHRVGGIEAERRGAAAGEQAAGEAEGERRLAHALRPGDQPGVVHPPRAHRLQQIASAAAWPSSSGLARGSGSAHGGAGTARARTTSNTRAATSASVARRRRSARTAPARRRRWRGSPRARARRNRRPAARSGRPHAARPAADAAPTSGRHVQHECQVGPQSEHARSAPRSLRDPRPGRSPDRPSWNRRTGRTPPRSRRPAPGGCVRATWSARAAKCSSVSASGDHAPRRTAAAPRSRSAPGAPPGSRVAAPAGPRRPAHRPAAAPGWTCPRPPRLRA